MSSSAITGPIFSDVRRSPSGSAAAPSWAFNESTGTGIYLASTDVLALSTAGLQRVVVDAAGNVGIGTDSPTAKLTSHATAFNPATADWTKAAIAASGSYGGGIAIIDGSAGYSLRAETSGTNFVIAQGSTSGGQTERMRIDANGNLIKKGNVGDITLSESGAGIFFSRDTANYLGANGGANSYLVFQTGGANSRMTIDASGNLLVGYTGGGAAVSPGVVKATGYNTKAGIGAGLGSNVFNINWTGSPQLWIDSTNVGTISLTSDYRIKKNVETQEQPALERIAQLRPVKYELADYKELFKADGVQREGFIAHELQAVIPSAVEGEKDAEEQIQSLKLDALCSVMVKAIQEQQEIIGKLQARLAALESKP